MGNMAAETSVAASVQARRPGQRGRKGDCYSPKGYRREIPKPLLIHRHLPFTLALTLGPEETGLLRQEIKQGHTTWTIRSGIPTRPLESAFRETVKVLSCLALSSV